MIKFFLIFLVAKNTPAATLVEKKLFITEKSYHAENIMVVNATTDDHCKFTKKNNEFIDFYWLMDRKRRKEIHPLIRLKVNERVSFMGINTEGDSFKIRMNDLSELKNDLKDITLEISSKLTDGTCQIKSILQLGRSAHFKKLNLKRSYCEVSTNFLGFPNGCKFLELSGTDADTDEALSVRFMANNDTNT